MRRCHLRGRGGGEHRGRADVRGQPEGSAVGADGDGSVFIGAEDLSASRPIALHDSRVWMAEAAVARHREHRDPGVDGAHKGLATEGSAAVMGWLH